MMQTAEFRVGDLFRLVNPKGGVNSRDLIEGNDYPYVAAKKTNNGVAKWVSGKNIPKESILDGNCIVFVQQGDGSAGYTTYQPYPFYAISCVCVGYIDDIDLTEEIGLYLVAHLDKNKALYSHSRSWNYKLIQNTKIELPVIPSDDPSHMYTSADIDWKYMQDYIAELEQDYIAELEQDYIAELDAYLKASNLDDTELTDEEKEVLKGPDKTKEFKIEELFELKHQTYKATKLDFCDYGKTPAYSSDSKNNGCVGYVSHKPEFIVSNDVPTYLVFGDHTRTRNIVHRSFVGMDNIKVLKPKQELSDCCLLYISTAWLKAIPVLGYARHWSVARAAKFLLPVTSTGTPDWHFMETYITAIEKLTIKDVVKYKNQMIKTTKQVVNC